MIQVQYGIVDIKERGNVIDVQQIIMHEDYVHGGNYPNDIAILRVRPRFLGDLIYWLDYSSSPDPWTSTISTPRLSSSLTNSQKFQTTSLLNFADGDTER